MSALPFDSGFFSSASPVPGLGGSGGFSGSSSATSGPAANRSINIIGATDGTLGGLNNLMTLASGSPQNGGYTPNMTRVVGNPVSAPNNMLVPLVVVGVAVLLLVVALK